MNVFLNEMRAHRKSLILWNIGIVFLIASGMSKYAGMSSTGQSMNDLMAEMPQSLQAIMGTGALDLSTAGGYYGVLFLYLVLMATIHATMLGAHIISKEERDKTVEFLFAKPILRSRIITAKLMAALVNIVIITAVSWASSILIVGNYSKGESVSSDIAITMVGLFIVQLLFLVIGTAIAAVSKKPKRAASLSSGILLITFILSIAIDLNDKLTNLKYLTPFKYYEAKHVMYGGGLDGIFILLSLVMVTILTIGTYVWYRKRDLNV